MDFFSPDYFSARERFRSAVLKAGGQIESILLNAKGPAEEDLTIDIGWFGSPAPRRVFIHSSGLHGVEGFAGSAIQLQWLEEGLPRIAPDCAIVIVHVMNPFGMAWLRRVNENNVDLNRNFLAAEEEYAGAPETYTRLNSFLNPESPSSRDWFPFRVIGKILRHGMAGLRQAVAGGQYDFPRGLFFGGKQHEQGPRRFQVYISGRLAAAERIVCIDIHTGLGRFGEDRLLVDGVTEASCVAMDSVYGDCLELLKSGDTGIAYQARGVLGGLYLRMFSAAQVCFAVQEFGTCHAMTVLAALRAENRGHYYGDASAQPEKARLLEVFCPVDQKWREKVLARGREVIAQSLDLTFAESAAGDSVTAD